VCERRTACYKPAARGEKAIETVVTEPFRLIIQRCSVLPPISSLVISLPLPNPEHGSSRVEIKFLLF
jgi:hypothetical protein